MAQTWLITGANRGIGLEHVRQAVAAGDTVIAATRDPAGATELAALAAAFPGLLQVERLEVADPASLAAFAARLAGTPVDVLVNNAGINRSTWPGAGAMDPAELDPALWQETLATNLFAPFAVTLALRPNLMLSARRLVVMMSSDLGSITANTMGGAYAYRASKAGLNMVMKGLSIDLKGDGITVVSMAPGWVRTDLGGEAAPWAAEDSVALQRQAIAGLTAADSGRFINLKGEPVAW
jgi:NAD(P)-dependent dehydrogenase (short-subunit alcohol dehydrogenase family)